MDTKYLPYLQNKGSIEVNALSVPPGEYVQLNKTQRN